MSEQYRQKLRRRLWLGVALVLFGLIMEAVLAFIYETPPAYSEEFDLVTHLLSGLAGILPIVSGADLVIKNRRLLRNPDEARKAEIAENDERSLKITALSWQVAGRIVIALAYLGIVASLIAFRLDIFGVCLAFFLVLSFSQMAVRKWYEKKL